VHVKYKISDKNLNDAIDQHAEQSSIEVHCILCCMDTSELLSNNDDNIALSYNENSNKNSD